MNDTSEVLTQLNECVFNGNCMKCGANGDRMVICKSLVADAIALLKEKQAEIKWLKRKSKWIVNTKKYGEDSYHCLLCGAIVEKDEAGRHYWQRCYHCGAYMELMDGTDRDYEKDETH